MKDASIRSNLSKINSLITAPFYNLLCAGEEKKPQYIGAKILDAGDIIQTLTGWTAIGYGRSEISLAKKIMTRTRDFRNKAAEAQKGTQAMDEAISGLSLKVNPIDSKRALYLVSAPPKEMNVDLIKELGTYLKSLAPESVIRSGDYPREKGMLDVTVILSELSDVEKVRSYFTKTISLITALKKRQEGIEDKYRGIEVTLKDIPSLI
jgi:hypothetical protein